MKGKLLIENFEENLTFSNGFEFKDDEYLKALENYEGFDLDVMLGKKEVEYKENNNEKTNINNNHYDNSLYSCECELLDSEHETVLSCHDFFDVVYRSNVVKHLTLMLNYDTMDYEFEEEFQEWVGDSNRLMNTVCVFGNSVLPKKDFYFEFINDANEKLLMKFNNVFLVKRDLNKLTIGIENMEIVQKF